MYNLYVHICVLDVCVCYVCTTYLFVYKHLCDGIGIHRTLCVVKNNLWINILCLFLVRNGISLVVFCWLCYSGWPRSSQKPSSLCFSSCSRSTGSTDARICVWLVSDLICQVTTPAQHPSLVSVTVVNTMMKMQLEKKIIYSFLEFVVLHRKAPRQEFKGGAAVGDCGRILLTGLYLGSLSATFSRQPSSNGFYYSVLSPLIRISSF